MKNQFIFLMVLPTILLLTSACTTRHFFVVSEPVREGSLEEISVDSFATAIEETEIAECPNNSLVEVRVKRDFFNSLIGVVTLGFYQRTDIEYYCGKRPDDDVPALGGGAPSGDTNNSRNDQGGE